MTRQLTLHDIDTRIARIADRADGRAAYAVTTADLSGTALVAQLSERQWWCHLYDSDSDAAEPGGWAAIGSSTASAEHAVRQAITLHADAAAVIAAEIDAHASRKRAEHRLAARRGQR